jgi:hypothetical protein
MTDCNHIIEVVQEQIGTVVDVQDRTLVDVQEVTYIIADAKMGPPGPQGLPGNSSGLFVAKAAANLSGHRVVLLNADRKLEYGSCDQEADMDRIIGVTNAAAEANMDCPVVSSGEMVENTWAWDVTLPVYLGTNGTLTQVPPEAPGAKFCMVVGFPISSTSIFIKPREPILIS